jgi:uncharacterized DUF497 family protein
MKVLGMEFEFDAGKSASNKEKHGIDFVEAQMLWRYAQSLDLDAQSKDEPRYARIGKINEIHWIAVYTVRRHTIRLISVRRASKDERRLYEEHIRQGSR